LTVGGFKNLRKTRIDFGKIVALISPNNYGKSNLLEAIDFGTDFLTASGKARKSMMAWVKGIPLSPELAGDDFFFDIELDAPLLGEYRHLHYGFAFSWLNDVGSGQKITDEWLETRKSESVRYTSLLKRGEGKYRKGYSTQAYRKIILDDSQLAIDVLASFEDIEISDAVKTIQGFRYQVCSSVDLQDRFAPPPFEFVESQNENRIGFEDDDIPKALSALKKDYPEKYGLFLDAAYTLFPEFKNISLQSFELKEDQPQHIDIVVTGVHPAGIPENKDGEGTIPIKIKEELYRLVIKSDYLNQPINASLMSTGTKRIIWLLANVFISSCTGISLIGIEELEASVHPRLLKSLLEILAESQEDTRLIITSHSPLLVQYLKLPQIYLGMPGGGVAAFRRIAALKNKSIAKASRNLGVSTGEYLFELMADGPDSAELMEHLIEETVLE